MTIFFFSSLAVLHKYKKRYINYTQNQKKIKKNHSATHRTVKLYSIPYTKVKPNETRKLHHLSIDERRRVRPPLLLSIYTSILKL